MLYIIKRSPPSKMIRVSIFWVELKLICKKFSLQNILFIYFFKIVLVNLSSTKKSLKILSNISPTHHLVSGYLFNFYTIFMVIYANAYLTDNYYCNGYVCIDERKNKNKKTTVISKNNGSHVGRTLNAFTRFLQKMLIFVIIMVKA